MSVLDIRNKMKSKAIEFKVIFKDDDWEIRETNSMGAYANVPAIIYHQCNSMHSTSNWMMDPYIWMYKSDLGNPCSVCVQLPPDHIQTMFILLNYDFLDLT